MLVKTYGSAVYGVEAITITVEVNVMPGNIHYYIVGLPDNAVEGKSATGRKRHKDHGLPDAPHQTGYKSGASQI